MRGIVHELHRKSETPGEHGLPKPAVRELEITVAGVVGDFNRYRHEEMRDDPTSAVLLVPVETLRSLQADGWPVQPGDLGENITTRGIPYEELKPGAKIQVGQAGLETTRPCDPCTNLYLLPYVGEEKGPKFLKTMVGRRGWYCRVTNPGTVRVDDVIDLQRR